LPSLQRFKTNNICIVNHNGISDIKFVAYLFCVVFITSLYYMFSGCVLLIHFSTCCRLSFPRVAGHFFQTLNLSFQCFGLHIYIALEFYFGLRNGSSIFIPLRSFSYQIIHFVHRYLPIWDQAICCNQTAMAGTCCHLNVAAVAGGMPLEALGCSTTAWYFTQPQVVFITYNFLAVVRFYISFSCIK